MSDFQSFAIDVSHLSVPEKNMVLQLAAAITGLEEPNWRLWHHDRILRIGRMRGFEKRGDFEVLFNGSTVDYLPAHYVEEWTMEDLLDMLNGEYVFGDEENEEENLVPAIPDGWRLVQDGNLSDGEYAYWHEETIHTESSEYVGDTPWRRFTLITERGVRDHIRRNSFLESQEGVFFVIKKVD